MAANAQARMRDNEDGPTTDKLGAVMKQGDSPRHSSADDLPQLLGQGPSSKTKTTYVKPMRNLLGQ